MDDATRTRISKMVPLLDERQRRIYLALESESLGRGGVDEVRELTGIGRNSLFDGRREARGLPEDPRARPKPPSSGRVRARGAGRKSVEEEQPGIVEGLLSLVDGSTVGSPENPLRWTTKSTPNLSEALAGMGFRAGSDTVARLLRENGFSLQRNRKYVESGNPGPDRDAQFSFINDLSASMLAAGQPVISPPTRSAAGGRPWAASATRRRRG